MRVARTLRGLSSPAEEVTGAWATAAVGAGPYSAGAGSAGGLNQYPDADSYSLGGPAAAGTVPAGTATAGAAVGSHTMVVGPGYREFDAMPAGGSGGPGEPVLQRWLFSTRIVYVLAAVLIGLGVVGGGWYLTSGRYKSVPAVGKLTAAQATSALRQAGFQVRTGPSATDDNVPAGDVIAASPSGKALPGATITLTISRGPKMITVPQVPATDTVQQAIAALRAAGLTVASTPKKVGVPSNPQIGAFGGTDPPAGTSVPENKPVYVEQVAGLGLPPLVGQNIQAIQGWAGQHNVSLQVTQQANDASAGTILSQSPQAGALVQPGQTVNVTVSSGPPTVQIPDVSGQSCDQAQQTLQQAGFTNVSVATGWFQKDQAIGTSPDTGQSVPGGTQVTLHCGWGGF